MTASSEPRARRLPRLHLTTDDSVLAHARFVELATETARAGGTRVAVHLRGPRTSGRALWELAERLSPIVRAAGAALFVNDRLDVALGCAAAGIQLGSTSFAVADARRLIGEGPWIGASIHDRAEGIRVAKEGADFVVAGTLYESGSHPGRSPAGLGWLAAVASLGRPIIGIGGITPERVPHVLAAGAYGVAVIRGVWGARSPAAAVAEYLRRLEQE